MIATAAGPGVALIIDGLSFAVLLVAAVLAVPAGRHATPAADTGAAADARAARGPRAAGAASGGDAAAASGLRILRTVPAAARLMVVVFWFNLLYMPVEVALPLLVRGPLHGTGAGLGLIWSGFGTGAVLGGLATTALRRIPRQRVLVAVISAWAMVMLLLAACPSVPAAAGVLALGGLVYAPFTGSSGGCPGLQAGEEPGVPRGGTGGSGGACGVFFVLLEQLVP